MIILSGFYCFPCVVEKTGHKQEKLEICVLLHVVLIRDGVGQLTWLECCKGWLWALQEGRAEMVRDARCCESAMEIPAVLPFR